MTQQSSSSALRKAPGYILKRIKRWLVARRLAHHFRNNPDHRARSVREAAAEARSADQILFLCWGNICRSPLAERYLRSRLTNREMSRIAVHSAGLGKYEGRKSPPGAVRVARRYGVDLSDHQSTRATETLVETSDVIFVMDYNDFHILASRYPEAEDRAYFLGVFAEGRAGTERDEPVIADPHGLNHEQFDQVYATIVQAVEEVADVIHGTRGSPPDGGH